MKKLFFIAMVAMVAMSTFAVEAVLIDFNRLGADDGELNNMASTIDVSEYATYDLSEANKLELKASLAIERWSVELAPSARYALNENKSIIKEVISRTADGEKLVMGVRVLFPKDQINSYAYIQPEFKIPVWAEKDGEYIFQDKGIGVVMNVGILKEMRFRVCGRNYTQHVQVVVQLPDREKTIDFGPLDFVGWRTLKWVNPQYINEVQDKEWSYDPVYPGKMPYVVFRGIKLIKDIRYEDGDFIVYFDRIDVDYDKAFIDTEFDIDDEAVWGIQAEWQDSVRKNEYRKLGKRQTQLFLEIQKKEMNDAASATTE